jgi:hypothetical protein
LKQQPTISVRHREGWFARTTELTGMHKRLAGLNKELSARTNQGKGFPVHVITLSDDGTHAQVQLCTGTVIEASASMLREVAPLGTLECRGQRKTLATGWLDNSTEAGKLINQMAIEIERLARSVQTLKARSLTGPSPSASSPRPTTVGRHLRGSELVPQDGQTTQQMYIKLPVSGKGGEFQIEASWTGAGQAVELNTAPIGAGCTVIGYSAIIPPPTEGVILELPVGFTFWFDPPDGLGPFEEFNATIDFDVTIAYSS